MKEFKKYQHIERFGTSEVEGIEFGECYIFPKIDGTNSSVWMDDESGLQAGSRKRHLTLDNDNAGFYDWAYNHLDLWAYLQDNPNHRLFGEWLVPHSLKTYRKDAWGKFYVFDIVDDKAPDAKIHIPYNQYQPLLEEYKINYIPPIAVMENGTYEQFINQLEKNVFLIEDGKGIGEGIVIKNYDFVNKYGRQTWAKIVTSEFKEKHSRLNGAPKIKGKKTVEQEIATKYTTSALCEKVKANIELDKNGFTSKEIPRLLNTIYHEIITEEAWNFVKEYKNPTIDFRKLQQTVFNQVKEKMPTLF